MCLIVLTPQQTISEAQRRLQRAVRLMSEAQLEVIQAAESVAMHEKNWSSGQYLEKPREMPSFVVTTSTDAT